MFKKPAIILLLCSISLFAFGQDKFHKYIEGNSNNPYKLLKSNNNYFILGWGDNGVEITKLNSCYHVVKRKQFLKGEFMPMEYNSNFVPLKDGSGFLISTRRKGRGLIFKIDTSLNVIWSKVYNDAFSIAELANGDIMCVTDTGSNLIRRDLVLACLSSDGNLKWIKKSVSINFFGSRKGIMATADGGALIYLGHYSGFIKTDANGNVKWFKNFAPRKYIDCIDFKVLSDGSFVGVGREGFNTGSPDQAIVIKYSADGNVDWHKNLDYNIYTIHPFRCIELPKKEILIMGGEGNLGYISILDFDGNVKFSKGYTPDKYPFFRDAVITPDNGFLFLGDMPYNKNSYSLIKTDALGEDSCSSYDFTFKESINYDQPEDQTVEFTSYKTSVTDTYISAKNIPFDEKYTCTNQVPFADLGPDTVICKVGSYTIDVGSRNPGCTFLWSTGKKTSSETFIKTGKYWVQITKGYCTHSDTVLVEILPKVLVDLGADKKICSYQEPLLDAGANAISYEWKTPNNEAFFTRNIYATDSGLYKVKVMAKGGCTDSDSVYVRYYNMPPAHAGPDTAICYGSSIYLQGSGGMSYLWTPADYLDDPEKQNPKATPPNTQRYYLITTGEMGCRDTATVLLKVKPPLQAKLYLNKVTVCAGNKAEVVVENASGGTGNYDFYWYNKDSTLTFYGQKISYIPTESHWLYMQMQDGCSKHFQDSVYMEVLPLPNIEFKVSAKEGCAPLTVNFKPDSSRNMQHKYLWEFGDGFSDTSYAPTHIYRYAGKYLASLKVTDENGCSNTYNSIDSIEVFPLPEAYFQAVPSEINIEKPTAVFNNLSRNATKYSWFFSDGTFSSEYSPKHNFSDTGNYSVKLIAENAFGCTDTFESIFKVHDIYRIFVPNVFTPGKDSLNNYFYPITTYASGYSMQIYNRWGERVFYSENGFEKWNGNFLGKPVQDDVYLYLITVTAKDKRKYYYKGLLHVLR